MTVRFVIMTVLPVKTAETAVRNRQQSYGDTHGTCTALAYPSM